MKRLSIFLYYDKDGVVDDYVYYFLNKLKEHSDELCVVVNEPLNDEGIKGLEKEADKLIIRKNIGYDSWAYKEAIEYYGYENLKKYDELVICNYTFFGPIYPLSELFQNMEKRGCDFWGINRHPAVNAEFVGVKIVEHIQSHFIAFRNTILNSTQFKQYWDTLKPVNSYLEAIAYHELRCTPYFESLGFSSDTYIDSTKYMQEYESENHSIRCAYQQVLEDRSPILKRKVLFVNKNVIVNPLLDTHKNFEVIQLIKNRTDYDVNLIYQNILRTQSFVRKPIIKKQYKYLLCMFLMPWRAKHYSKKWREWQHNEIYLEDLNSYFKKKKSFKKTI